jgi:hypothetical protein
MQKKPKPRAIFPHRREMRQEAGNMYNLVGIAKDALIVAGQGEKVDALIDDVFNNSKSYEDAIKKIKKYVDIY